MKAVNTLLANKQVYGYEGWEHSIGE